uniref:GAGA-binding transcriptional activator n=1 Tax=Eutrema halophilum TaxID=98038 RepID=C7SI06_EUTHA|nr:unknown [Eutrema halophilum]
MDDDGFRNWGYYEPAAATFKGSLGLQLMSTIDRNTKPFLPGREPNLMIGSNGSYHPREHESSIPMNYSWMNQPKDNKFFNMLPPNYNNMMHQPVLNSSRFKENSIPPPPPPLEDKLNKKRKTKSCNTTTTLKAKKLQKPKLESDTTNNVQHQQQQQRVKPVKKRVLML